MQEILRPLLGRGVEVFLDDILVYTPDVQTHQDLGHIISAGGISVDLRKINAIVEWLLPQDITQLRGFLGMAGFYRRFIQGFSKIAVPLTDALKQSLKLPLQLSAEARPIHQRDLSAPRSSRRHRLRQRHKVNLWVLANLYGHPRHKTKHVNCFPPRVRWSKREAKPGTGGYAAPFHPRKARHMGRITAPHGVCI
eukprot:TRINITY_DN7879_c0_g1_i9.p1 TRINITY_DN7879_c0_g1~~TRINITY_DN7879_c0_g1_i9.p1  ORF type:complete len:195 (-),score=7.06 TRINITY_DN7879_c0_g1_i9:69-653(-)